MTVPITRGHCHWAITFGNVVGRGSDKNFKFLLALRLYEILGLDLLAGGMWGRVSGAGGPLLCMLYFSLCLDNNSHVKCFCVFFFFPSPSSLPHWVSQFFKFLIPLPGLDAEETLLLMIYSFLSTLTWSKILELGWVNGLWFLLLLTSPHNFFEKYVTTP